MLTTVQRAQAWLAPDQGQLVSTNDAMIQRLVQAFSALVLNAMNRDQLQRVTRTENYKGGRTGTLLLRQWPVLSVQSVMLGSQAVVSTDVNLEQRLINPGHQRIYLPAGRTFESNLNSGVTVSYTSGFTTTETIVVPDDAAATFVTSQMWLADHGVTRLDGTPVTGYTVDSSGVYTPPNGLAGISLLVTYSHVPADIEQVVIDEIGASFRSRSRIGEASKALPQGGGTLSFVPRRLMDISVAALQTYRLVVPI